MSAKRVHAGQILHFIGMLQFMGISRLPSKKDYWSTHQWMSSHPVCLSFGMTRDHFCFLWRHFHMVEPYGNEDENFSEDLEGDIFEWDFVKGGDDGIEQGEYDEKKKHWFYKIEPLIKQVSE